MNRLRALLMGFAATVGAGGIAAYNGVFSNPTPPAQLASTPAAGEAAKTGSETPATAPEAAKTAPAAPSATTEVAKAAPEAATAPATAESPAAPAAADMAAPTFDVLRVEPDGSVLIAGKAAPESQIEVLSGAEVLGATKAELNGDFAIILNNPLKPGDYQLVLRATGTDGKAATSIETATVSVPETVKGQVLALVAEPGKPSRIITAPEKPVETAQAATAETTPAAPAEAAPAADAAPAAATPETPSVATPEIAPAPADAAPADAVPAAVADVTVGGEVKAPATDAVAVEQSVVIEAVETEGGKIFVAGSAKGVKTVRIYANDQALGDAIPGEGDRFLGEFQKDLAVGDYIIKAEGLAADGATVLTTSSVPFQQQSDAPAVADTTAPAAPDANAPAAAAATASADTATPAAPAAPKPKAVIIRRGDTLWQISRRVYGRGVRYSTIYLANKDVTENPNRIFPGQVFKVPETTPEGDSANAAEIEKRAAPAEITPAQ